MPNLTEWLNYLILTRGMKTLIPNQRLNLKDVKKVSNAGRLILGKLPDNYNPKVDVVLGPRCLIGKEKHYPNWKSFKFHDVYSDRSFRKKEAKIAYQIANSQLPKIAEELNSAHNQSYSLGFWRIIVMPWLLNMTMVSLKRYREVQFLISLHGQKNLKVPVLSQDHDWQLLDNSSLWERAFRNPLFDYWITSQFVKIMAPQSWQLQHQKTSIPDYTLKNTEHLRQFKPRSRPRLAIERLSGMRRHHQIFFSLYCSLISTFRSKTTLKKDIGNTKIPISNFTKEFFTVLDKILKLCRPMSLRDHFNIYNSSAKKMSYYSGRLLLASPGNLHHTISGKFELAHAFENGERIVSTQHGAGYGIWDATFLSEIEYTHHAFLSWGWTKHSGHSVRAIPIASPLISEFVKRCKSKRSSQIILIGTEIALSCNRFNSEAEPLELLQYRQMKLDLYNNLNEEIKENFQYRPFPKIGPGYIEDEEFVKKHIPKITIIRNNIETKIQKAGLVIIDYPGTLLHCLTSSNVPIIAIWEKDSWPISESAEQQFDYLRRAGILHHSVVSAASHINRVWPNMDDWWQKPSTIKLRNAWLEKHGQSTNLWWISWLKALWEVNQLPKLELVSTTRK